jgi:molybdate transport system substrate-binding protein
MTAFVSNQARNQESDNMSPLEVKLLCSIALRPLLRDIKPSFEKLTGHRLAMEFMASPHVARRIRARECFDVAISNPSIIDDLIAGGAIAPSTRTPIARSDINVAARTKIDIGSTEAFLRVLLAANSIAISNGGVGAHFSQQLDRLEHAGAIRPKLKTVPAFSGAEVVARGEADLAIIAAVAISGVAGVENAGRIPQEFQLYIDFAGGVGAEAIRPEAAMALLRFLISKEARIAMEALDLRSP